MPQSPTDAEHTFSRRNFMAASAASALAATSAPASTNAAPSEEFIYEVQRTDAEWRAMLSKDEYNILRKGSTELPKTSPLWNETSEGFYHCKGCSLTSYDGRWKVILDKGWAFFVHSQPNAILTDIDGPVAEYGARMDAGPGAYVEVHCRRCSSHLGHLLIADGQQLHCINGTALDFRPA